MPWRALGRQEDLELDFSGVRDGRRGALVTHVLAACADGEVDLDHAWRLTLAGRAGGLAAIYAETRESRELPLALRCPACGEVLQVALPLPSLLDLARGAEEQRTLVIARANGDPLVVRRPTGDDQRRWQQSVYDSPADAERAVLASLLEAETDLDAADAARVAEAMAELDPLPGLTVSSRCPNCAAENDHAVDVEAILLRELAREHASLLGEVHRLASRYGWTESDVLAIPRWRRRAYLSLIDGETA
jgi:hypothetical protein